jgi:histidyl-tRNA synthetase
MEPIKALRGFRDVYGEEIEKFQRIETVCKRYLTLLGYNEIEIPSLEKTELFKRSIGDTTDIVEKEMFTFVDRSGESVTLRPEGTAGMVRAYLQAAMYARERISKLFTLGPMFRHERPQKGRFRQFYQMDVEVFGVAEPQIDAELLWIIHLILKDLGVQSHIMEINSVGCRECRPDFRLALVEYLETRKASLCQDCLNRLQRNPLRILDCKNEACRNVVSDAPFLADHLCPTCREHFHNCTWALEQFGVPFVVNKRLVRGLDYYTRTVFEVTSNDLGAQKAFLAGGRYDNLVEEMGGPSVPGCGFAIGMERLSMLVPPGPFSDKPRTFLAIVGEEAEKYRIPLLKSFTHAGLPLSYAIPARSLKSQMKYAAGLGVNYVLILAGEEIAKSIIIIRDMKDGSQQELPLDPGALPGLIYR